MENHRHHRIAQSIRKTSISLDFVLLELWRRLDIGLNVHFCPTLSPLPLWSASIIQSTVGGQGRKTNRRHVASRSKTAEINSPADTTVACLSYGRVHTLWPNTAARLQTAGQAGIDSAQWYFPTSWHNKTLGCQYVNLTCQRRLTLQGIYLSYSCSCLKANNWLVKRVLPTQK